MKRAFKITEDGSHTLYVKELNEHYHSIHGAIAESQHIFIDAAFRACDKQELRVLEIGFGTGLNGLLTIFESLKEKRIVYYHGVEKYPLTMDEALLLNYDSLLVNSGISILDFHRKAWEEDYKIAPSFTLRKEKADIRNFKATGLFDVIYFDAFAPDIQPELWSTEIFKKIYNLTAPGGVLTTYSVKGDVRRSLITAGFEVEKIPGPKGKKEILRAWKR